MRGERIDQAVSACFLEAIEPARLEIALATLDQLETQAKRIDQQARRQIERAQYEADLACRRYRAVDPDNRLVARSLEREWNEKLLNFLSPNMLSHAHGAVPFPLDAKLDQCLSHLVREPTTGRFLLSQEMIDLILPISKKIERHMVALLLILLQGKQSLSPIFRIG